MTDALTDNILVLVRHGESEWNKLNLFTGWRNPDLTDKGLIEARVAGRMIRDHRVKFDIAFTSALKRAQHTLDIILGEIGQTDVPIIRDPRLNERDYGELSGLNKDEARKRWGESQVLLWRRSYDIAPPGGESLKDTLARVRPYYDSTIWPQIAQGKNVIIAAHGNSLRALIMILENLSGDEILERELATGAPILYRLGADGHAIDRKDLLPARSLAAPPEDYML
jgi:2,3-bisphosphoglycerate-dependent phosphoglycerate mutase